jgi:hypothetical protein
MAAAFPNPPLACALRRVFKTDLLVVDHEWLSDHQEFAGLAAMMDTTYADEAVTIYRLRPSLSQCPPMRLDVLRP